MDTYTEEELAILAQGKSLGGRVIFDDNVEFVVGVDGYIPPEVGKTVAFMNTKILSTVHEGKLLKVSIWPDSRRERLNPLLFTVDELRAGVQNQIGALAARLPGAKLKIRAMPSKLKDGVVRQNLQVVGLVEASPFSGGMVGSVTHNAPVVNNHAVDNTVPYPTGGNVPF